MTPVQEFHTSDEMRRRYSDAKSRLWGPRPKPVRFIPPQKNPDLPVHAPRPIRPPRPKRPEISDPVILHSECRRIQIMVCSYFKIDRAEILSERRDSKVIRPRHIAMYLCKTLSSKSYPEIGRRFGGRDHTTVLNACRKIGKRIQTDRVLAAEIKTLTGWVRR